ncbi:zinc-ribbon domain-containing protein [uncultured Methylobacterium sp.]|uniref:zinc-ribbon domain-containing protein n=1 Tax=uncultured Methylobacterium sp. TaxID=157278 RepID=UPI0035CC4352
MLIVCPTCASEYRIETGRVGMEGRSVRCAACRETWFIAPAEVLAALEAEMEAAREPETAADAVSDAAWAEAAAAVRGAAAEPVIDNVPVPPRRANARRPKPGYKPLRQGRGIAGLSPALAAGLVALAALPLACLARVPVVQALPQAAGVFARIGLPVNLRGLEIRDVVAFRNPADGDRPAELVVEGDLVGVARDAAVPPIAVEMRDAAGRTVKTYAIAPPRRALTQGETARFSARFPEPPASGRTLDLRFADAATDAAATAKRAEAAGH